MTNTTTIQPHNERPAAVWSSGGAGYDQISRGIADSIEHCVLRLNPQRGERILDLATGTGWTSRLVARRGAKVTGADIAGDLLGAARERAKAEGLDIDYQVGDAEKLPFADGQFDAVISTCGIMFATRPELAAAEIAQGNPQGRTRDPDDVASRQQSLQDVHGDEAIHAATAHARAALTVRMGQAGARPGTAGVCRSICASRREPRSIASPMARPHGTRSRPATVQPRRWPAASTRRGGRSFAGTSSPSTTASRPSSASAYRANTCSRSVRAADPAQPNPLIRSTTMTSTVGFDPKDLESKVKAMYRDVAENPSGEFHFEMGRAMAERLGYEPEDLDRIPAAAIESFAGVGYYFDLAALKPGETVIDLGSGSGMDSFIAGAQGGVARAASSAST